MFISISIWIYKIKILNTVLFILILLKEASYIRK